MSARADTTTKRLGAGRPATQLWLLLVPVAVVLFYGVVYPNLSLVTSSLREPGGGWGLETFATALAQASTREAIVSSLVLSIATTLGCALVGIPLALVVDRVDIPARRFFAAVAVSPLVLPPLVGTIAFVFLYGESGIATRAIMKAFALASAPYKLKGFWAVLLFHVYTIYPYFYVFVSAALKRVDPAAEEAARTLGASSAYRLRRIVLPSIRGAIGAGALAAFMTSMASFSAPYLFGGGLRVLTLQIYESKINNEVALATVQTLLLAALSLVSLAVFSRLERATPVATKGLVARRRARLSPTARSVAFAAGLALAVFVLLPHMAVILLSFARVERWTTEVLPPVYTLANFGRVFSDSRFKDPIINSVVLATVSALANLVFGVAAAYLVARYRFPGRSVVVTLLLLPWALPGTVLAYQIIASYSTPSWLTAGTILAGSFWLLPSVYFLRNMPLVTRAVGVNLSQLDPNLEPAARSLGASWLYAVRRIVLPLVLPGAISGTMLAFSLALGEFVASIVAFIYSNRPVSIGIDQALRQGDTGAAAAYGVILIAGVAATLAAGAAFDARAVQANG